MAGDRERCLAAGMDDYLAKPVKPADVDTVLTRWVRSQPAESHSGSAQTPSVAAARPGAGPRPGSFEELREMGRGVDSMLSELMKSFVARAPALLAVLGDAIEDVDGLAARRATHELSGAAANLGAISVVTLCAELEAMNTAGRLDGCQELFVRLRIEMELVDVALRAEMRLPG